MQATVGQLLVNEVLPAPLRDYTRQLDKKNTTKLLSQLAKEYPDLYRDVTKRYLQIGRRGSELSGGFSPTIESFLTSSVGREYRSKAKAAVADILSDKSLDKETRNQKIVEALQSISGDFTDKLMEEAVADKNPLAMQIASGVRGNPGNLRSLIGADLLYSDQSGKAVPFPVLRSYSEGLSPSEFWAAAHGARKGIIDPKLATRDAGFLCLAEGTQVRTVLDPLRPIEKIRPGELVYGSDLEGNITPTRVLACHDNGTREVYAYRFELQSQPYPIFLDIIATEDHKVLAVDDDKNIVTPLRDVSQRNLPLVNESGDVATFNEQMLVGEVPTYDITVEHPDSLFVLTNGLIVSNSKQLVQAVHRGVVSAEDSPEGADENRGLIADIEDNESVGALLARKTGPYPRNTEITPKLLRHLKDQGVKKILVRSPLVGGASDGSLYAKDVGVREKGRLPTIGEAPSVTAAQALSEPLSQGQLCLAEGTMVRMADRTMKPIEKIEVGDLVLGADLEGNLTPTHVVNTYRNGIQPTRSFWTLNGVIRCTDKHKVLTCNCGKNEIMPIGKAFYYYRDIVTILDNSVTCNTILDVADNGCVETFDIEVDNPTHLFSLANGMIVSNSSKHSGGVFGSSAEQAVSGFDYVNQLIQVPKSFPGGASHAQEDGRITKITDAPAGGKYVYVGQHEHYVPVDAELQVKEGDTIEAGDVLSSGIPNPSEAVRHKGIGEGRRYFLNSFRDAMQSAGMKAHRRNIELLSKGLINHVQLTDEVAQYVPGDVLPYQLLESIYKPRASAKKLNPKKAVGKYLEKPVLHYTVGTKIRPSMLKDLEEFEIEDLVVDDTPPPFEPQMIRGMANLQNDPDWLVRMFGSGLKGSLLKGVHEGGSTNIQGSSFVPKMVTGGSFDDPDSVLKSPLSKTSQEEPLNRATGRNNLAGALWENAAAHSDIGQAIDFASSLVRGEDMRGSLNMDPQVSAQPMSPELIALAQRIAPLVARNQQMAENAKSRADWLLKSRPRKPDETTFQFLKDLGGRNLQNLGQLAQMGFSLAPVGTILGGGTPAGDIIGKKFDDLLFEAPDFLNDQLRDLGVGIEGYKDPSRLDYVGVDLPTMSPENLENYLIPHNATSPEGFSYNYQNPNAYVYYRDRDTLPSTLDLELDVDGRKVPLPLVTEVPFPARTGVQGIARLTFGKELGGQNYFYKPAALQLGVKPEQLRELVESAVPEATLSGKFLGKRRLDSVLDRIDFDKLRSGLREITGKDYNILPSDRSLGFTNNPVVIDMAVYNQEVRDAAREGRPLDYEKTVRGLQAIQETYNDSQTVPETHTNTPKAYSDPGAYQNPSWITSDQPLVPVTSASPVDPEAYSEPGTYQNPSWIPSDQPLVPASSVRPPVQPATPTAARDPREYAIRQQLNQPTPQVNRQSIPDAYSVTQSDDGQTTLTPQAPPQGLKPGWMPNTTQPIQTNTTPTSTATKQIPGVTPQGTPGLK